MDWYTIDCTKIDTPALFIDRDSVTLNIQKAIDIARNIDRLRPHVKTHKSIEVAKLQLAAGIQKFKCATIAEAEMLARAGAKDVLIAYQPQGPKINRVKNLVLKYPKTKFSILIDNDITARQIQQVFVDTVINYYFDVNDGHFRTGIKPQNCLDLFENIKEFTALRLVGVHCYDGHIRMPDLDERIQEATSAFMPVRILYDQLSKITRRKLKIVAGGSPSFPVHARFHDVECSPGTFIFWDERYATNYPELNFQKAAAVATRVISQTDHYTYCLDLGHKRIASEFSMPRVKLITSAVYKQIGHSEEHMIIKTKKPDVFEVGQVLFGIPYHICPTVALYDHLIVVEEGEVVDRWEVTARDRSIGV